MNDLQMPFEPINNRMSSEVYRMEPTQNGLITYELWQVAKLCQTNNALYIPLHP